MAQVERAREEKRDNKRQAKKEGRSRRAASQGTMELLGCDWIALAALAMAFAAQGGALRIGLTRDGGAAALGCYMGDDYATEYIRPNEDFTAALTDIAEAWLEEGATAFNSVHEFALQDLKNRWFG